MLNATKPTYKEVKATAEDRKHLAFELAHESLPEVLKSRKGAVSKSSISYAPLDLKAINELRKWELSKLRKAVWDWERVNRSYKNHPKKFDVTVWHKDHTLCSASIGRPTWGGGKLRLDVIEANPAGSLLDGIVLDINLTAYGFYARLMNCTELRIMHPVNEQVKNYYLGKTGFKFDAKGNFCYKALV